MTQFLSRSAIWAGAIACIPGASLADLDASTVWNDWKSYVEGFGYTVTGDERLVGGSLAVSDLQMRMQIPEVDFTIGFGDLVLQEQGDGSVRIEMPRETVMTFQQQAQGESASGKLLYTHDGLDIVVTGEPANMTYTYAANTLDFTLQDMVVNGVPMTEEMMDIDMRVLGMAGTTQMSTGNLRMYNQNFTSDGLVYAVSFNDPQSNERVKMDGRLDGLNFSGGGGIPTGFDATDINAMMEAGFDFSGKFGYTAGGLEMAFDGSDGAGTISSSSQGGAFAVAMSQAGLVYDIAQRQQQVNMLVPDMPFPISFSMAGADLDIRMPVTKSEEAQNFAFGISLDDFAMADGLWGLFDPAGQLPRTPADIVLDLAGTAKVLINFLDPLQMAALESSGAMPGELESLNLRQLLVDAVGAQLTGSGAFTFDNSDLQTFGGMPKPTGAIDLKLVGGNGLLDKLVAMGFVPEAQAMQARLMLGLFAVPGEAPDTLTSRLEVNEQGHVLANGQRIQ